jgi:PAS domain S-box-containing protein
LVSDPPEPRIAALERELADAVLAKRRTEEALDRITEAFFTLDREWRVTYANATALRLIGSRGGPADRAAIIGKRIFEVIEPSEHSGFRSRYLQALTEQKPQVFEEYYEPFELWVEVHVWPSPEGLSIFITDITERRRAEAERERAQRLDSLGLLAAGIAHDFNNLLSAIQGNISLARAGRADAADRLQAAEDACARAAELSKRMLTFARGGAPARRAADVGAVLVEQAELATRGTAVRVDLDLPADLRPVHADPTQLAQVVQNLILNAVQAMPDGGDIRVSARNVAAGVQVEIADTGPGIAQEHLAHVFDPFFTTKTTGTGLGLATAWSIVRRHGGSLEIATSSSAGTTFRFVLPAAPIAAEGEAVAAPKPRGHGRALVMDDDASVREVLTLALRALGYTVEAVSRGEEAIARFAESRRSGQPFEVLVLDLTVAGGLGGVACLEELRRLDPDVVAIVTSGYSESGVLSDPAAHGFASSLAKPFTLDDLAVSLARAGR